MPNITLNWHSLQLRHRQDSFDDPDPVVTKGDA